MQYYLAPLEGLTTYIYRNAYHRYFEPMDKYFTPFLSPHTKKTFTAKEMNELAPEHNEGLFVVPQILSNHADEFLDTARKIQALGYEEINLNLGCPSGTVAAKNRGSGFLALTKELDHFLEEVFSHMTCRLSIKTRIGKEDPEEFYEILDIYNKYEMTELIIHPRVQQDFYKNQPRMEMIEYAVQHSKHKICYNGDLFTTEDAARVASDYPQIECLMFGRGVIARPDLIGEIKGSQKTTPDQFWAFHDEIYAGYQEIMSGDKNVLFRMKELWFYLKDSFPGEGKLWKQIKKAQNLRDYESIVNTVFDR